MSDPILTPSEIAQFLAAKAIGHATAFLDGRIDAGALGQQADALCGELLVVSGEPACNHLSDPTRLLVVVMMRAACASPGPRADRWQSIMHGFVDLVRHESAETRRRKAVNA